MASKSRPNSPAPRGRSFGMIARIMRWAPLDFVGFEGGFFPTPRLPVLLVRGQQNAVEACKGLNHHLFGHPLSPRFGWLPASDFATHEQLSIEVSIREAQRGELPGDKAGNVHRVAQKAATLGESLSQTGKPFYVFFRFFPNVHGPLPLERFVVLPDEEIGTAIEAEAQRWAAKNGKLITEQLRKLKAQSARRTGGPPRREQDREPSKLSAAPLTADQTAMLEQLADELAPQMEEAKAWELPAQDQQDWEQAKGVAPRNAKFLEWHEAKETDTYHKPKRIQEKWWAMTDAERAVICPDNPAKVSLAAVSKGISRARALRGDPPKKPKIKRRQTRRKA